MKRVLAAACSSSAPEEKELDEEATYPSEEELDEETIYHLAQMGADQDAKDMHGNTPRQLLINSLQPVEESRSTSSSAAAAEELPSKDAGHSEWSITLEQMDADAIGALLWSFDLKQREVAIAEINKKKSKALYERMHKPTSSQPSSAAAASVEPETAWLFGVEEYLVNLSFAGRIDGISSEVEHLESSGGIKADRLLICSSLKLRIFKDMLLKSQYDIQTQKLIFASQEYLSHLDRQALADIFSEYKINIELCCHNSQAELSAINKMADLTKGWTLMNAIKSRDVAAVKVLLKRGVSVDASASRCDSTYPYTPLMIATKLHLLPIVKLLLYYGADVNATAPIPVSKAPLLSYNETALSLAVQNENLDISSELLAYKADINKATRDRNTPISFAAQNGNTELIELLLKHGADINLPNLYDIYPIYYAAHNGYLKAVTLLLDNKAQLNIGSCVALHGAAKFGHAKIVDLLIKRSACIEHDFLGQTATYVAAKNGHSAVVDLLIQGGASVNQLYGEAGGLSYTPLSIAVMERRVEVVRVIMNSPKVSSANASYALELIHNINKTDSDADKIFELILMNCKGVVRLVDIKSLVRFLESHNCYAPKWSLIPFQDKASKCADILHEWYKVTCSDVTYYPDLVASRDSNIEKINKTIQRFDFNTSMSPEESLVVIQRHVAEKESEDAIMTLLQIFKMWCPVNLTEIYNPLIMYQKFLDKQSETPLEIQNLILHNAYNMWNLKRCLVDHFITTEAVAMLVINYLPPSRMTEPPVGYVNLYYNPPAAAAAAPESVPEPGLIQAQSPVDDIQDELDIARAAHAANPSRYTSLAVMYAEAALHTLHASIHDQGGESQFMGAAAAASTDDDFGG